MSTIKKGILGGFQGKVGTVVGSTWKGQSVMRSVAASVKNPNTPAQQAQRMRFGLAGSVVYANMDLIRVGYRALTRDMTAANAAMSEVLSQAITGEYPDIVLDYAKVRLSKGKLEMLQGFSAAVAAPGQLTLRWEPAVTSNAGMPGDLVHAGLFDAESGKAIPFLNCAKRQDGQAVLQIPAAGQGASCHLYVFLTSPEGLGTASRRESVSDTLYGGVVET